MGDVIGTIVGGLLAGLIIGPLARLVLPGKQDISFGMTIVVGAVGAIVGGFVAQALGVGQTPGVDWIKHFIQIGVAAGVIVWYLNTQGGKSASG